MSTINPVITNQTVQNPNFKGERKTKLVSVSQGDGYEARVYETEASTGKKWGVGIASYFVPGLGQAINGQWGKAAGFFGGSILSGVLAYTGAMKPLIDMAKSDILESVKNGKQLPKSSKGGVPLMVIGVLGTIGTTIWSIVDAVKNAKSETTQIIPKNNTQNVNKVV